MIESSSADRLPESRHGNFGRGSAQTWYQRIKPKILRCSKQRRRTWVAMRWRSAMEKRWCSACGEPFEPRPQSPRQAFCSKPGCQRARKLLWQLAKRRTDADYHLDQAEAQKVWRSKNSEYWKSYRETHPDYTSTNRAKQRYRNKSRVPAHPMIAKNDASSPWPPRAGLFRLTEVSPSQQGRPRSWTVLLAPVQAAPA